MIVLSEAVLVIATPFDVTAFNQSFSDYDYEHEHGNRHFPDRQMAGIAGQVGRIVEQTRRNGCAKGRNRKRRVETKITDLALKSFLV